MAGKLMGPLGKNSAAKVKGAKGPNASKNQTAQPGPAVTGTKRGRGRRKAY